MSNINYQNAYIMRNLIVVLSILVSQLVIAQEQIVDFLLPAKTYHFNQKEKYRYAAGEGGNLGLIVSFTNNKRKINNVFSAGYVKNSYGKWSLLATYGKSYNATKWLRIELNVGLATNYGEAYKATYFVDEDGELFTEAKEGAKKVVATPKKRAENMGILYKNDIIPVGALTIKANVNKWIGTAVSINPYYVNAALMINLK